MRITHTFVELEVSNAAYLEIWELLAKAGYHHAFIDGAIDMNGIALTRKRGERKPEAQAGLEIKDGHPLEGGKVVSLAGGCCVPVYRCACGREQTAEYEGFNGGISAKVAQSVGWNLADGGWMCPFCSGDTEKLFQVFGAKG